MYKSDQERIVTGVLAAHIALRSSHKFSKIIILKSPSQTCLLFYYPISIETHYLYKSTSFTATCTRFVHQPFHRVLTRELSYTRIQFTARLTNHNPGCISISFNDITQYYSCFININNFLSRKLNEPEGLRNIRNNLDTFMIFWPLHCIDFCCGA